MLPDRSDLQLVAQSAGCYSLLVFFSRKTRHPKQERELVLFKSVAKPFMSQTQPSDFWQPKPVLYEVFQVAVLVVCPQTFPSSPISPAAEQFCLSHALTFFLPLHERQPSRTPLQPWIQKPYTQIQFLRHSQHYLASGHPRAFSVTAFFYKVLSFLRKHTVELPITLSPPFFFLCFFTKCR